MNFNCNRKIKALITQSFTSVSVIALLAYFLVGVIPNLYSHFMDYSGAQGHIILYIELHYYFLSNIRIYQNKCTQ